MRHFGVVALPSGTVTFLFTDLEGSTRLWEEHPEAMPGVSARHDAILRVEVESRRGVIVKTTGDGVHAVFAVASDAVDAAVSAQLAFCAEPWGSPGPLRVRMGVHTGAAESRDGDYFGSVVNRAARIMSVAHGGQILVSLATSELVRNMPVELMDLGEHRLRDLGHREHLFQVNRDGLPRDFPPLRSIDEFPTNLPLQTTSFVGRDEDMALVVEALERARVVTLTGVGGVGKTRLAVQVAAELLPRFRDGAWLCELGPLGDAEGLPDVVGTALGVQPRQRMSMVDSIVDALREKQMLFVLDNCEHLIGAAARLVETIVQACPMVVVLATSREGLGLRGERQMTVPSLDLVTESLQLFVDRARDVTGRFELDDSNRNAVVQVCSRLDGIPLALELAAARTRMMTPAEIATRLDERFRLLTGGSRTAVERHQTLRQAVDWSYELLELGERDLFDSLGVFAGGFTLEAAEAVMRGDKVEVMDGIAQLVDKSLVVADRSGVESRYRLLETLRQYALERLEDAGRSDDIRRRHAEWCAHFVGLAAESSVGPDEKLWRDRLDRETENLRAAITWAVERDDTDLAFRLVASVPLFGVMFREIGYQLAAFASQALRTSDGIGHPRYAQVLALQAFDASNRGRFEDAERDARIAISHMATPGVEESPDALGALWNTLIFAGRADEALTLSDELLRIGYTSGNDLYLFVGRNLVVGTLFACGRASEGKTLAEENLELADKLGSAGLSCLARFALGGALAQDDPERARVLFRESAEFGRTGGLEFMTAMALARLARMGIDDLDHEWARDFHAAVDLSVDKGDLRTLQSLFGMFSHVLAVNGRPESAAILHAHHNAAAPAAANRAEQLSRQRTIEILHAALGTERVDELSSIGAAMSVGAAVDLTRAELDRVIETAVSRE